MSQRGNYTRAPGPFPCPLPSSLPDVPCGPVPCAPMRDAPLQHHLERKRQQETTRQTLERVTDAPRINVPFNPFIK